MEVSKNRSNKQSRTYRISGIGVMTALICALGPLSIPIGPIPISLTMLAIFITVYAVGAKDGVISCLIYLLVGFIGLPVFSGFSSGPGKLLGPTGGYLIGFVFMTIISGYFIDKYINRWYMCVLGMGLGTILCYILGTLWLAYQANMTAKAALLAGVIPFALGDLIKIMVSAYIGPKIRSRLVRANLYQG